MAGAGLLLLIGAIWGLSFTLTKIVIGAGAVPVTLAFWQTALGAMILFVLGRRPALDRAHLRFYAVTGILGSALPSLLVATAARHVDAGVLAVAMALAPMLCLMLCIAGRIERVSARRALGMALGLAAVVVIARPGGAAAMAGLLLAVGAAASYALEDVFIAVGRPPVSGAFTLLSGMLTAGALWLLPGVALSGHWVPLAADAQGAWLALALIASSNLLAYGAFVALVTRSGAVFASQVAYVVVAAGVLWGIAVLGERHPGGFWLGAALMLAGLALTLPRGERRAATRR